MLLNQQLSFVPGSVRDVPARADNNLRRSRSRRTGSRSPHKLSAMKLSRRVYRVSCRRAWRSYLKSIYKARRVSV